MAGPTPGATINATDYIASSAGAGSSGKIPYLGTDGQLDRTFVAKHVKFGGTGADSALTITSGATNIDLGGAAVVIKNYTSISITGTGSLTFTNPHTNGTVIILKSQGNVTLTSSATPMIDASGMGGAGGSGGVQNTTGASTFGADGSNGISPTVNIDAGNSGSGTPAYQGGSVPTVFTTATTMAYLTYQLLAQKYPKMSPGSGGGGGTGSYTSGGSGSVIGGTGGRGGASLIIECAGAWNFTTASGISVAGKVGADGSKTGTPGSYGASGGGGGGGGSFLGLYNTLTANSGTITTSAGTGGLTLSSGASYTGAGGGASRINAGSNGTSAGNGAKSGGDGGAGDSFITENTEFA